MWLVSVNIVVEHYMQSISVSLMLVTSTMTTILFYCSGGGHQSFTRQDFWLERVAKGERASLTWRRALAMSPAEILQGK